jgi:hypothetical protein
MARRNSKTRRWHRTIGLGAGVFALFMVISGMVINHSSDLGLDQNHVSRPFLLSWYGLGEVPDLTSFPVNQRWLSFAGSDLYLDDQHVTAATAGVGAVAFGDWLLVAGIDELLIVDEDGQLIERLAWKQAGADGIELLGQSEHGPVLKSGGRYWLADTELMDWHTIERPEHEPTWSIAADAPGNVNEFIKRQYNGQAISLERFTLDIHSGRIFGSWGTIVYDILALALGFLALSGLVLWGRGRRNGRGNGNGNHSSNKKR